MRSPCARTNVQVWTAYVDDHSATNRGKRGQASKRTHGQTHVYTEKSTKRKWRVSGSGSGNPAITFPRRFAVYYNKRTKNERNTANGQ